MLFKIIIIQLVFLFFFNFIFKRFNSSLISLANNMIQILKEFHSRLTKGFLISRGENLIKQLGHFEVSFLVKFKKNTDSIISYKFYSTILELLLTLNKKFGAPIKSRVKIIKRSLVKDIHLEKKLLAEIKGGLFQFILISFITWFFIYFVEKMLLLKLNQSVALLIIFLQISGLIIFLTAYNFIKKREYKDFDTIIKMITVMNVLLEVGLPQTKIVEYAGSNELSNLKKKNLISICDRFKLLIISWQKHGISIMDDLSILEEEISFVLDESGRLFFKKVEILKYTILTLFYLSAYFIYLFTLTNSFLT